MAALAWLVVAHGGLYGALAEGAIVVIIVLFLGWIWLSERRRRGRRGARYAQMRDE